MSNVPSNLIPTRITQLPMAPVASEDGLLLFIYQGNSYQIRAGDLLSVAGVPTTRQVSAGTGLTGGGPLATDITLSVAVGGIGSAQLAASGVTPGTYGSDTTVPVFTVDATGRVMSITNVAVAVSGYVPESRQVIAGTGLTGGGALNANVTLVANLSDSTPASGYQTGASGVATAMSRSDHKHPAVDLANDNEVDGLLGLSNGGTAKSIVPDAGAIIWCGADGLYVSVTGSAGQVLVSGGASAPTWGSAMIISDQPANVVYAGPASGPNGPSAFRALVAADLPSGTGTVTSVAALTLGTTGTDLSSTVANGSTTPVITLQVPTASATNRGALSSTDWSTFNGKQDAFGNQLANVVYAGPTGASGPPSFRALIAADVPTLNQDTTGTAAKANALNSATTVVNVSAATAPSTGQILTAVDSTHATWQAPAPGMVYPGAGIPNSTGSAWGTSYSVTGTGTVAVLATAPTISDLTASGKVDWTGGHVTYVPASGDIQTYVTAASAGDTLILSAATYVVTATITVNKAILIKGQGLSATKITTATADIAAFTLTASSARVTDLYIGHSGTGTTYGIYAGDGLTQLQISNVIAVLGGNGLKYGIWSQSSITISNCEMYITSANLNSNGVMIYNETGATANISANIQNVRVLSTGATLNNRGIVFNNNNVANTIAGNVTNCNLNAYASTGATDIALYVNSTTTNNVTVNAYNSLFNGADSDVTVIGTNVLTLSNCTLVNGTTSGTITKAGTQVGANQTLSGTLNVTGVATFGNSAVLGTPASGNFSTGTFTWPTFNQNTTGKSAKTDALNSATTAVNVSSATAPTAGQILTATSGTAATWQGISGGTF